MRDSELCGIVGIFQICSMIPVCSKQRYQGNVSIIISEKKRKSSNMPHAVGFVAVESWHLAEKPFREYAML